MTNNKVVIGYDEYQELKEFKRKRMYRTHKTPSHTSWSLMNPYEKLPDEITDYTEDEFLKKIEENIVKLKDLHHEAVEVGMLKQMLDNYRVKAECDRTELDKYRKLLSKIYESSLLSFIFRKELKGE